MSFVLAPWISEHQLARQCVPIIMARLPRGMGAEGISHRSFRNPDGSSMIRSRFWQSQSAVAVEAIKKSGITAKDVAAIGITNQRETTILWEARHRQADS